MEDVEQTLRIASFHAPIKEDPRRSTELWFEDGTVVLQTEGTIFRVYRGILSSSSVVFRQMFTIPQPETTETYMGCPLVHLQDSAEELANYLKAIHDINFYDTIASKDFRVLTGVLRLSTKYDSRHLRRKCIEWITRIFPSTLAGWDQVSTQTPLRTFTNAAIAIELGQTCNVPIILPSAYYCCSVAPMMFLLDGPPDESPRRQLDWPEKRICLKARPKLEQRAKMQVLKFLYTTSGANCQSPRDCNHIRISVSGLVNEYFSKDDHDTWSPLSQKIQAIVRAYKDGSSCPTCCSIAVDGSAAERTNCWNDLPSFFDLGSWEKLKLSEDDDD